MKINVEQAAAFLRQMDNVVILCHKSPDGDTLGSGYGLLYGLRAGLPGTGVWQKGGPVH